MNFEDIASQRAAFSQELLKENTVRAITRSTIDAINVKKYREQLKHDGIFLLLKKYVDTDNTDKAMELLDKMKAFDSEDPIDEVSSIDQLSFG